MDTTALRELAVRAAHAGGTLLAERFGSTQSGVVSKSTRTDLVSDADRDAEVLILTMIGNARPDDSIQAEEGGSASGTTGVRWIVDPLDGTINFLWGHPHWSVSIAAVDESGDLVGVVYDPGRRETFVSERNQGASLDGQPLRRSTATDLAEALVGTGFAYDPDERARQAAALASVVPVVRDIRRAGSAALDLAWVAAGRLDAFFETGLSPWDWAAGAALVREAGGTAEVITRGPGRPDLFLAARPGLHEPLMTLLISAGVIG